ncbi:hypothetical protein RD792_001659 [Penstemon davidsonii]|uniref:Tify domain-containing protein n=1 Tax=Penstemon davidsonii TaxID=160366 RepID=A0ABR0DP00_9LAMI|nr:hypothetical protein RD792_001659 [Penstemon davidsonii]
MNTRRAAFTAATAAVHRRRPPSTHPIFSIPIPPLPKENPPPIPPTSQNPNFTRISHLLSDPALKPGPELEEALNVAQINPSSNILLEIFNHFDSSPKPLFTLFNWSQKQPNYEFSLPVFNAMVNSLCRAREFDSAWTLIFDQIYGGATKSLNLDTFVIMIRRYARAGLPLEAIRTFDYASSLNISYDCDSTKNLFEILLDSLCKEGHVRIASEYFDKYRAKDPSWSPSIRIYNILLNGWFRSRKLKNAEKLWVQMKKEDIKPTVITYGTLIEGLCRMRRPEMAMELVNEMKSKGVEPNAIVYNPIIDALGEAGRFKEALGMLERFSILESGPTISTYNSLVKGFCKAGDIVEACKILKMMMASKCLPTTTTYSYFFKYFAKVGESEVGLNLYTKLIRSGYEPDRLTYHLLVKMLCNEGKLDLTLQIIKEMRAKGLDLDLAASTMLIHLLCKMLRYDEAFSEFEDMFRRGIVPQHLTYQRMTEELEKRGMNEMSRKMHDLMASVPHSTKLPDTCRSSKTVSLERKKTIIQRAETMSDMLKTCKSSRELVKRRSQSEKLNNSKNNKANANNVNGGGESEVKLTTFHDFLGKKDQGPESVPAAAGGGRPPQEVLPSNTSDLGSERHVSDHLEGIPFYGSRGPESSYRFTGNKRSNSDTLMASSRDKFPIGQGDSQDSPLLTKLLRYSGGERSRRPIDEEAASVGMHQTRPISGSFLGPAFQYPPRATPRGYQAPLNIFKDVNVGPSVISQTAADEGSRTGIKGSTLNNIISTAGARQQPSGVLMRSGKQKFGISEPESSPNLSEVGTETSGRQMTIFYGGQAHVFDNVHPNKVDVIMRLAGSNGGSWSTTSYTPNFSAAKPENRIPCSDAILRELHCMGGHPTKVFGLALLFRIAP